MQQCIIQHDPLLTGFNGCNGNRSVLIVIIDVLLVVGLMTNVYTVSGRFYWLSWQRRRLILNRI